MPVEFLSDEEAAGFGRYRGPPTQADLDRLFFLDDADRALVSKRRLDHMRLGFASQLVTVRYLGAFPVDVLDVPHRVVEYLAEQLGVEDPSCLKLYGERAQTRNGPLRPRICESKRVRSASVDLATISRCVIRLRQSLRPAATLHRRRNTMKDQARIYAIVLGLFGMFAGYAAIDAAPDDASTSVWFLAAANAIAPWVVAGMVVWAAREIIQAMKENSVDQGT
jgi:hypothetical protein